VIRLKNVVLPAPFGPMSATISPGWMLSATLDTARRPPNIIVTLLASTSAIGCVLLGRCLRVVDGAGIAMLEVPELLVLFVADPVVLGLQLSCTPLARDHALRPDRHHHDHEQAEDEEAVAGDNRCDVAGDL